MTRSEGEGIKMTQRQITFLGIGAIGLPMALRLMNAGMDVTAVDVGADARDRAASAGMRTESHPGSAASADAVMVMVATPEQMTAALLGPGGVLDRMKPDSVLILLSTVGPEAVREVEAAAPAGIRVVDAPVTGGVARALTGDLVLLASGAPEALGEAAPFMEPLGTTAVCGDSIGDGQSHKIVNQLLCSVHIVAAAEALSLAAELGLDPKAVHSVISGGAAGSWMLSDRGPRMLLEDPEVTSAVDIFVKDSGLVVEAAARVGLMTPLVEVAHQRFLEAKASGWGRDDDSSVIRTYKPGVD